MVIIKNPIIINKKVITEDITVTPSTVQQTINRSEDKYINTVTVNAVTSDIDANITPENIKKDVTILGVTGTLETGGGTTTGEFMCRVVDYDGTILKQENLNTGDTFTLPTIPTHEKLIFEDWSSPVAIVDNTIIVGNSDITIGPVYKTTSGLTEIDITLTKATGLTVTCNMVGVKNWGDGTENSSTSHTYTNYGDYTITCNGTSIPAGASSSGGMFGSSSSNKNYYATAVRIGELVISVGNYAFYHCSGLTSIITPNSVTSIGDNAFSWCSGLTSITIPDSVTSIGEYAFSWCSSLSSITIGNRVTNIGDYAFADCSVLTSITIPDSVTSIGYSAFNGCSSLTGDLIIPDSVTSIGGSVFTDCSSLTSVSLGDSVTSIGSWAFYNCSNLTSVSLGEGVTSIGDYAFASSGLSSITIPNSVESLGANVFRGCANLLKYDFTSHTTIPTLSNTNAFNNINGLCKIYVPDALYDDWIVATNWATYADHIYKASEMLSVTMCDETTLCENNTIIYEEE